MPRCVVCGQWEPFRETRCSVCGGELRLGLPAPPPRRRALTEEERRQRDRQEESAARGYVVFAAVVAAAFALVVALPAVLAWLVLVPGASFSLPRFAGAVLVGGTAAIVPAVAVMWLLDSVPGAEGVSDEWSDRLGFSAYAIGALVGGVAAFAFLRWSTGT